MPKGVAQPNEIWLRQTVGESVGGSGGESTEAMPEGVASRREDRLATLSQAAAAPFYSRCAGVQPAHRAGLIELAALLAQQQQGQIVPLAITVARPHMTRSQLEGAIYKSEDLLAKASLFNQPSR